MILMTRWCPAPVPRVTNLRHRHRTSPPWEVTLIHSNKNRSQGTPAFSSPRALAASPVLRYLLYPARSSDLLPYNIICSRIRSRLWCARRGAPMTNFIPRSHRRSRPPPPFTRARGCVGVPVWTQPSERIPPSHHRANTDHDQYAVQYPVTPPICAWRP